VLDGLVITNRFLPCDALDKVVNIAHTFGSGKCVSDTIRRARAECVKRRTLLHKIEK
jgi:hypothetical protein